MAWAFTLKEEGALEGCRQRRAGPDSPLEATVGRTDCGDEGGSRE